MSTNDRNMRRSDEIRRRRLAQSQPEPGLEATPASRPRRSWLARFKPASRPAAKSGQHNLRRAYNAPTQRTVRPAAPPPVMTRSAGLPSAAARRTKAPRRVYNVSLEAGAEARLPALPRPRLDWRLASSLLAAFLGAVLYWLWTAPTYQVQAAQIDGLQRLTKGEVSRALALNGSPIFTVDADSMRQRLLKDFPEFTAVRVQVDFPNTVSITVTERVPVLVWRQAGQDQLVDRQGMTFPTRHDISMADYPIVEAAGSPPLAQEKAPLAMEPAESQSRLQDLLPKELLPETLGKHVPDDGRPIALLTENMVTAVLRMKDVLPSGAQMLYDPAHGFGWTDKRGWQVYLGSAEQIELKLHVYRAILDKLKSEGKKPLLVSVEYPYAPYYRVREEQ